MTQLVKEYKSRRLFYRKYLYNIRVHTPLSHLFRKAEQHDDNLSGTENRIKQVSEAHRKVVTKLNKQSPNAPVKTASEVQIPRATIGFWFGTQLISRNHIRDAQTVLHALRQCSDYHIRVEGKKLSIFTNDDTLYSKIIPNLRKGGHEYHRPDDDYKKFLTQHSDVIVVNRKPELKYRVTLNGKKTGIDNLTTWLEANHDKSGVSEIVLNKLKNEKWHDGCYFYIRDDKVLTLVTMLAGNCVRRVDKLVYAGDIDK